MLPARKSEISMETFYGATLNAMTLEDDPRHKVCLQETLGDDFVQLGFWYLLRAVWNHNLKAFQITEWPSLSIQSDVMISLSAESILRRMIPGTEQPQAAVPHFRCVLGNTIACRFSTLLAFHEISGWRNLVAGLEKPPFNSAQVWSQLVQTYHQVKCHHWPAHPMSPANHLFWKSDYQPEGGYTDTEFYSIANLSDLLRFVTGEDVVIEAQFQPDACLPWIGYREQAQVMIALALLEAPKFAEVQHKFLSRQLRQEDISQLLLQASRRMTYLLRLFDLTWGLTSEECHPMQNQLWDSLILAAHDRWCTDFNSKAAIPYEPAWMKWRQSVTQAAWIPWHRTISETHPTLDIEAELAKLHIKKQTSDHDQDR